MIDDARTRGIRGGCGFLLRVRRTYTPTSIGIPKVRVRLSVAGPDLVVLTDGSLDWYRELLSTFASQRVVVIGPAPDPAYERTARQAGAGAWLSTDQIGDDLILSMRRLLGCTHDHAQPAA